MKRSKKFWVFLLTAAVLLPAAALAGFVAYRRSAPQPTRRPRPQPVADAGEPRLVVQLGHSGGASSVAYSPNGRLIVSGGVEDMTAILWDATTGREIRRFVGHRNQINSVAFSPDGRFVLTGCGGGEFGEWEVEVNDFTARLWDVSDGREVRKFEGHTGSVNSVAFSLDGKHILTGSDDKTVRMWDAGTGGVVAQLSHTSAVTAVAYSPDNRYILAAGDEARLWETYSRGLVRAFGKRQKQIGSVSFSPDGRFVLLGEATPDHELEMPKEWRGDTGLGVSQWEVSTGQKIRDLPGFGAAVFSPDARLIAAAGAGPEGAGAQVWDAQVNVKLYDLKGSYDPNYEMVAGVVRAIAFSPDGSDIVTSHTAVRSSGNVIAEFGEKGLFVYAAANGERRRALAGDTPKHSLAELVGGGVNPIATTGRLIQIGGGLWDKSTGTKVALQGLGPPMSLEVPQALSKDGSLFLSRVYDPTPAKSSAGGTFVWNTETGERVVRLTQESYAARITPNNKYVLLETIDIAEGDEAGDFLLNLFELRTGKLKWSFRLKVDAFGMNTRQLSPERTFAALSPDGRFVYARQQDQEFYPEEPGEEIHMPTVADELTVIETETGSVLQRFQTPEQSLLQGLHVSPNGRLITMNGTSVLEVSSGQELHKLFPQNPETWSDGVFSPNSKLLATQKFGGESGGSTAVQIWNVETGKLLRELPLKFGAAATLKFSPDSTRLLVNHNASDTKHIVELLDVSTGKRAYSFEHYDVITSGGFSPDGRTVVTASQDGSSRIWDVATGKEVCRLTSFKNGDWVVTTPDGRFDTNNLERAEGLHWVMTSEPLRPLPIEIFMRQYYEPRLLARVAAGETLKPLPSLAALNRTQPDVRITDIRPDSPDTVQVTVEVATTGSAGQKDSAGKPLESGVFDVRLFRDGQLVGYAPREVAQPEEASWWSWLRPAEPPPAEGEVPLDEKGRARLTFSQVRLPRIGIEQVEFSAYAFNYDRIKSVTDRRSYKIAPRLDQAKGRAYVISLGVNAYERDGLNLRFAANDARQAQAGVVGRLAALGAYEEAVGVALISDYAVTLPDGRSVTAQEATTQEVRAGQKRVTENNATKAHLRAVLDVLAGRPVDAALLRQVPHADRLRPARPEDLIIITASSHGYTDSDGVFYFVPFDTGAAPVNSKEFRQRCLSSDELSLWLRDVDAGELVMVVDACHSAAAIEGSDFKPGPMGSRGLGQLSYDKGMRILTATQADNVALEANRVRQGLLMYALLQDGLGAWQADHRPRDKAIELSEWLSYGVFRVPRLYEEVKTGRAPSAKDSVTVIRETVDAGEPAEDKTQGRTQQPSLFDFSRRRREVIIARNR